MNKGLKVSAAMLGLALLIVGNQAVAATGHSQLVAPDTPTSNRPISNLGQGMVDPDIIYTSDGAIMPGHIGKRSHPPVSSGDGAIQPNQVINTDDRHQVGPNTTFPFSAIARVTMVFPDGTSHWCTGWMISSRAVATAGHCVWTQHDWVHNVKVTPGESDSSATEKPYGTCNGTTLYSVIGWTVNGDTDHDYGVIRLDCTVGNDTGWFGYRWTSADMTGIAERITGYPDIHPYEQWADDDQIRYTDTYKLYYRNDTSHGDSGAPVYESNNSNCAGGYCGIAIHTGYDGPGYNRGTRITQTVFNNLNTWR